MKIGMSKKIFTILALLGLLVGGSTVAMAKVEFAVAPFTADTDGWIADNLRASFIDGLRANATAIETLGQLPTEEKELLQALNEKGIKYLVRGKALSTITSSQQTKTYKDGEMVDKTVYNCDIYYAISFISCKTGRVAYSTVTSNYAKYKDSEGDAIKDASRINYPTSVLPEEYHQSLGQITSLGQSSKKGAKTVFATISKGVPYKGRVYTVYEQIPSEEWGFEAGEMLLSKIGELKLKDADQEDKNLEMKVTDGEEEIKSVFDAGIHQMIIK